MRKPLLATLAGLALVLTGPGPAGGQVDDARAQQGLVYEGLQRAAPDGRCGGGYRLVSAGPGGRAVCTHGPDPAPEGADVRAERQPPPARTAGATVPCVGNGTSGYRVQLIYARAANRADEYARWLPSMQEWAARIDEVFSASAAETGGTRHVAFVHNASCVPIIDNVVLSNSGDDDFDATYGELRAKGYNRADRKFLVWVDATKYCGIAEIQYDDDPATTNASNGHPDVPGEIGRVDKGCWGEDNLVEAHELVHLLGGVQRSAPNGTHNSHCRDESDRLCYDDGGGPVFVACADPAHENRLDCNHDDYFSTSPPAGSYLDTHWNVARSRFLAGPAPPVRVAAGSTFYRDGSSSRLTGAGTSVTLFAVGARPDTGYVLTIGKGSGTSACALDSVAVNPAVRRPAADGLIGRTTGSLSRPPGQWQLCFSATDGSTYTAPVMVTVI